MTVIYESKDGVELGREVVGSVNAPKAGTEITVPHKFLPAGISRMRVKAEEIAYDSDDAHGTIRCIESYSA